MDFIKGLFGNKEVKSIRENEKYALESIKFKEDEDSTLIKEKYEKYKKVLENSKDNKVNIFLKIKIGNRRKQIVISPNIV